MHEHINSDRESDTILEKKLHDDDMDSDSSSDYEEDEELQSFNPIVTDESDDLFGQHQATASLHDNEQPVAAPKRSSAVKVHNDSSNDDNDKQGTNIGADTHRSSQVSLLKRHSVKIHNGNDENNDENIENRSSDEEEELTGTDSRIALQLSAAFANLSAMEGHESIHHPQKEDSESSDEKRDLSRNRKSIRSLDSATQEEAEESHLPVASKSLPADEANHTGEEQTFSTVRSSTSHSEKSDYVEKDPDDIRNEDKSDHDSNDDDYAAMISPVVTSTKSGTEPLAASDRSALRLSTISVSELNDIPLNEELQGSMSPESIHPTSVDNDSQLSLVHRALESRSSLPALPPKDFEPPQESDHPSETDTTRRVRSNSSGSYLINSFWSTIKGTRKSTDQGSYPSRAEDRPPLPSAALLSKRSKSQPGILSDADNQADFRSSKRQSDLDWGFWMQILNVERLQRMDPRLLRDHLQRGIPSSLRGMIWQVLTKSKEIKLERDYHELLTLPSPDEKMIDRDVSRTFPEHPLFSERDGSGQKRLRNVIMAYSIYNPSIGYCQGLAFIVGPLLLYMPEEDAFSVLVRLMQDYKLGENYARGMHGLQLRLFQFDRLLAEHAPHLANHLAQCGIRSNMYASQWIITLFAYKFPLNLVSRIYDCVLTLGSDYVINISIVLLKHNAADILSMGFDDLLKFLKTGLLEAYKEDDGQLLITEAMRMDIPTRRFRQLKKEFEALAAKEMANEMAAKQLREANMALQSKANELESIMNQGQSELFDLRDQLSDNFQTLVQKRDENVALRDIVTTLHEEVQALRHKPSESSSTMALVNEEEGLDRHAAELEARLSHAEAILIDMKVRFAECEDEREVLQQKLREMKRLISA